MPLMSELETAIEPDGKSESRRARVGAIASRYNPTDPVDFAALKKELVRIDTVAHKFARFDSWPIHNALSRAAAQLSWVNMSRLPFVNVSAALKEIIPLPGDDAFSLVAPDDKPSIGSKTLMVEGEGLELGYDFTNAPALDWPAINEQIDADAKAATVMILSSVLTRWSLTCEGEPFPLEQMGLLQLKPLAFILLVLSKECGPRHRQLVSAAIKIGGKLHEI